MEQLWPIQRCIVLLSGEITVMAVTRYRFLDQICSRLDDPWLMTQQNHVCSFKYLCATHMEIDMRDDLNQSWYCCKTHRAQRSCCSDFCCFPSGYHWFHCYRHVWKHKCEAYYDYRWKWIWQERGGKQEEGGGQENLKHEVCTTAQSLRPFGYVADINININIKCSTHIATGQFVAKDYHQIMSISTFESIL